MIPCPHCQQLVEVLDQHLGTLFTCPHCNAVYFIDWSGQPESGADPLPESKPEPTAELASEALPEVAPEAPFDFSEVTDFANSDSPVGPLSYNLAIEGLDSSKLVSQLKEAMIDARFGWDVDALLMNLEGGRLMLNGISPAKASVLVNRIKYLPLKISWRQDVLSGA